MQKKELQDETYWKMVWNQFCTHPLGKYSLVLIVIFTLIGIYAPFLASSKPLFAIYDGMWFFPIFRYLFYTEFFSKRIDIFFNLLMFSIPLIVLAVHYGKNYAKKICVVIATVHMSLFLYISYTQTMDPATDLLLNRVKFEAMQFQRTLRSGDPLTQSEPKYANWRYDVQYMNLYARLNLLLRYQQRQKQHTRLTNNYSSHFESTLPTLWQVDQENIQEEIVRQKSVMKKWVSKYPESKQRFTVWQNNQIVLSDDQRMELLNDRSIVEKYEAAQEKLIYVGEKESWIQQELEKVSFQVLPLLREFHWQDDAGGEQKMNQSIGWYERTRINRKDLVAGLLFGVRISLFVGFVAVGLSMIIGIPVGSMAGYYGGKFDIVLCRILEVWESMPVFFMLLMVVAITQSKSIFLVITVIGFFGWTGFSRFIRGEFLKQRHLSYVEACQALGFNDRRIIFSHILPNALPPLLTLLPFAIMGAITSEAGLSFLGLGEEGSCSWGVLMDEGRTAFPGESYLLWPPAILLTVLLIAIALVGDAVRDALDPKLHQN